MDYRDIRVQIGGIVYTELRELQVIQKFNEHAQIVLTALITEVQAEICFHVFDVDALIEVSFEIDEKPQYLFRGLVTEMTVDADQDVYQLRIAGVSCSQRLDRVAQSRSFQNSKETVRNLIRQIIGNFSGADCLVDANVADHAIGQFILQYRETPWQLLKRIAAGFGLGLIPDATADGPKFWFGLPEKGQTKAFSTAPYCVQKRLNHYRINAVYPSSKANEANFVIYEVESTANFPVGSWVRFQEKDYVVAEVNFEMRQNVLENHYVLAPEKALWQIPVHNPLLAGLALDARVIATQKDQVKVQLEIDGAQNDAEACWFSYASGYTAEGHTGLYCMPESGDTVKLMFPSECEKDTYVVSSIRVQEKDGEHLQKPDVKYFRVVHESDTENQIAKEFEVSDQTLIIQLAGKESNLQVWLDDQKGVVISSSNEIEITAKQDITLTTQGNLRILSEKEIELQCRESNIKMNDQIVVDGTKIYRES